MRRRRWGINQDAQIENIKAPPNGIPEPTVLLSHLLTYPLTVGKCIGSIPESNVNINIIGARAEATLPMQFWPEIFNLAPPSLRSINIRFWGPESMERNEQVIAVAGIDGEEGEKARTVKLKFMSPSKRFEDESEHECEYKDSASAVNFLFNPGIGHPHLKEGWNTFVEKLRDRDLSKFRLTAFSAADRDRDSALLKCLGIDVTTETNEFASRKEHLADKSSNELARANQFILNLGSKE